LAGFLAFSACEPADSRVAELAQRVGSAFARVLHQPLRKAAQESATHLTGVDVDDAWTANLEAMVEDASNDIELLGDIGEVVRSPWAQWTMEFGLVTFSTALAVHPGDGHRPFCMVLSLASDGRVIARPAAGNPQKRCEDTVLEDLARGL
jgi:hypothetical protein